MKQTTLSSKMPKRKLFADIFSSLLLIFFVHTVISTFINISTLENLLGVFYTRHSTEVAWTIIIIEFLIVIFLFIPLMRIAGLVLTILFALIAIFTIIRAPHYPHDFGGMLNDISRTQKYLAYGCLILIALLAIILSMKKAIAQAKEESEIVVFT